MNSSYRQIEVSDEGGCVKSIKPVPSAETARWAQDISRKSQTGRDLFVRKEEPFFTDPVPFVIAPPEDSGEPFFSHNHCPAITWCDNGDLIAAWFSTKNERGTEMTILASRLRWGAKQWEPASEFFNAPDRNMTGTALFNDGSGTLYHFNGMGLEGVEGFENLVVLLRSSQDCGMSWTPPRVISPGARYQRGNQVIAGTSVTPGGLWIQPCDATPGGEGPTAIHVSRDGGKSWHYPGGHIRGIHAGVVGLKDGRLLAMGRAQTIEGRMPVSISGDQGKSWSCAASEFPPITSGQRFVLMRLREGPLLLVSFTDPSRALRDAGSDELLPGLKEGCRRGMKFKDGTGGSFTGYGMFATLSFDEGESWPVRRLLAPRQGTFNGGAWTGTFEADAAHAEPKGYLAATQAPDNTIHLISSRLHYRFNLAWLNAGA